MTQESPEMEDPKTSEIKENVSKNCCACCNCARKLSSSPNILICQICVGFTILLVVGVVFLICGAFYLDSGQWMLLTGSVCVSVAVSIIGLILCYICCYNMTIRRKQANALESCEQDAENTRKSDYPMGPLIVLILPTTTSPQPSDGKSINKELSSTTSTPDFLGRSHKNNPPLASAETLTPSLRSSRGSVDSNL